MVKNVSESESNVTQGIMNKFFAKNCKKKKNSSQLDLKIFLVPPSPLPRIGGVGGHEELLEFVNWRFRFGILLSEINVFQ